MQTSIMPRRRFAALLAALPAALLAVFLTSCSSTPAAFTPGTAEPAASSPAPSATLSAKTPAVACPVTEPEWAKPPEDSAVDDPPGYGYYYINPDRSMWAGAWWMGEDVPPLRVSEEGFEGGLKVGWFRPAGIDLEVTGRRTDGDAPALQFEAPCCYPTRFQASGLYFPTAGCWEVNAKAGKSELSFVVWIEP